MGRYTKKPPRVTTAARLRHIRMQAVARFPCRGFTLVEAMTSMVILVVLVMALLGVVPATYRYTQRCLMRVQAIAAGQQYLDTIRQYIKTTGVDTGLPAAPAVQIDPGKGFISHLAMQSPGDFSMTPTCAAI